MSMKVVIDGKVRSVKVDRNVLQQLADVLKVPTGGGELQGIFLHITAPGRQAGGGGGRGSTGTASAARSTGSRSRAGAATRRRK